MSGKCILHYSFSVFIKPEEMRGSGKSAYITVFANLMGRFGRAENKKTVIYLRPQEKELMKALGTLFSETGQKIPPIFISWVSIELFSFFPCHTFLFLLNKSYSYL